MDEQRKTIYHLESLIKRCLEESEKAGDIEVHGGTQMRKVIVNSDNIIQHISMTIIGELHELEIVRKMGPMFRQFRSLERDFEFLDAVQAKYSSLQGLRIETPSSKIPEK